MRVVEPRDDEPAAQVHHLGLRPDEAADFFGGARGQDAAAPERDRVRRREALSAPDLSTREDKIRCDRM